MRAGDGLLLAGRGGDGVVVDIGAVREGRKIGGYSWLRLEAFVTITDRGIEEA